MGYEGEKEGRRDRRGESQKINKEGEGKERRRLVRMEGTGDREEK